MEVYWIRAIGNKFNSHSLHALQLCDIHTHTCQFLNRSIAHSTDVVDNLAAFGLAYVFVKFFVGVLQEVKQVGVVLVHDRPGFIKILICVLILSSSIALLLIITGRYMYIHHLNRSMHNFVSQLVRLCDAQVILSSLSLFLFLFLFLFLSLPPSLFPPLILSPSLHS